MTKLRQQTDLCKLSGGTYNRRRLFQVSTNAELLIETLQHYRAEGRYKLHAFVVMPDHIHLIITTRDKTLPQKHPPRKGTPSGVPIKRPAEGATALPKAVFQRTSPPPIAPIH